MNDQCPVKIVSDPILGYRTELVIHINLDQSSEFQSFNPEEKKNEKEKKNDQKRKRDLIYKN